MEISIIIVCVFWKKSEKGILINFGYNIGNVFFCFFGGVVNFFFINYMYDIIDILMIYK